MSDQAPAAPTPTTDDLNPAQLNYEQIKDVKLREEAENKIEAWYEELDKDVSAVLEKHGVKMYGLGFQHPGTKKYMLASRGQLYDVAKCTTSIALFMRRRVLTDLKIDDGQNG